MILSALLKCLLTTRYLNVSQTKFQGVARDNNYNKHGYLYRINEIVGVFRIGIRIQKF